MNSFAAIVDHCGAPDMAYHMDMPIDRVYQWKKRNFIPAHHWRALLQYSKARRVKLTAERLVEMAHERGRG